MNTKEKSYFFKKTLINNYFHFLSIHVLLFYLPLICSFSLGPTSSFLISVFVSTLQLPLLFHFLLSISSCHLLCELFQVRTGLWVWTVSTSVMATSGKIMSHLTCSPMMRELTVGSHSPLQTSKPSHRTKSHRWGNQVMCKTSSQKSQIK